MDMLVVATHHKCASNPLTRVLRDYCRAKGLVFTPIEGGDADVVPDDCDVLVLSNARYEYCRRFVNRSVIHIFRNPLDMVVSAYYSHLRTHDTKYWPQLAVQRKILERQDKWQGMISTAIFMERPDFNSRVMGPLASLRRWDFEGSPFCETRMEDLVKAPYETMSRAFPGFFSDDAAEYFAKMDFRALSKGRDPGQVDDFSHFRSGLPDQWKDELPNDLAVALAETFRPMLGKYYPETLEFLDGDHPVAGATFRAIGAKMNYFQRLMRRGCPTRDI
jgi:hypothetical protein